LRRELETNDGDTGDVQEVLEDEVDVDVVSTSDSPSLKIQKPAYIDCIRRGIK